MNKPLEGIRVLDLTQAYSGPFCTMHLADMGAEVIKVESMSGDQSRTWGPFKNDYSAYYAYVNRNKHGITLNLKTEEGKQILRELIKTSDVICENFKVGTFEKMGFTWETIHEINPRIIYGSISGYGLEGPLSKRPAYDIIAQGMSGMMSVTGHPESPMCKCGPSIGDNYTGTYLALGIMMALFQREKTGEGQRLDVSMVDTLFSVLENFVVMYTVGGITPKRQGNIDPSAAPFDSFVAKDGEFVMGCGVDKMYVSLCEAMGREDLITDPRYITNQDRCDNYLPDLKAQIEAWTKTKTIAELDEIIAGANIPFGPINDIPTICESQLIKDRNMLWTVNDPGLGEVRIPGCPIKIHGQVDDVQKAAPLLSEDTDKLLSGILGFTEEQLKDLRSNGIVL